MTNLTAVATVVDAPSINDLRDTVEREHAATLANLNRSLQHALRVGDALLALKEQIPQGEWMKWVDENLSFSIGAAGQYMRLATYREAVLEGGATSVQQAMTKLAPMPYRRHGVRRQHPMRDYAVRLRKQGRPLAEIAAECGVSMATISTWATGSDRKYRERQVRLVRQRRLERRALQREQEAKAVKAKGGPTAEAYALVRRALQQLDSAISEDDWDPAARGELSSAMSQLYGAEDALVTALKVGKKDRLPMKGARPRAGLNPA